MFFRSVGILYWVVGVKFVSPELNVCLSIYTNGDVQVYLRPEGFDTVTQCEDWLCDRNKLNLFASEYSLFLNVKVFLDILGKNMNEIWKPVKGTVGKYKISNFGNVIGSRGNRLHPTKMKIGYLKVSLSLDGKVKPHYIHRLVATHFLEYHDGLEFVVNHKDGDKHNNSVSNLEFISRKDNAKHWASKNRSLNAGRKRTGYCKRGHKFVGDKTYCLECLRLKKMGIKFEPPDDCDWKKIVGTDYLISNTGLVWSDKTQTILKPGTDSPGYKYVILRINGVSKRHSVHRMVAEAFISAIPKGLVVDHINSDKVDNNVHNLRIVSRKQNSGYSREKVIDSGKHGFKFDENQVAEMKWLATNTSLGNSDIEKHYGISSSFLNAILKGRQWKHVLSGKPKTTNTELERISNIRLEKERNIREVKWLVQNTSMRQKEISKHYGVSEDTVSSIKVGRSYRDIEPSEPSRFKKF